MNFWQHLSASNAFDLQGITETVANHFSELITRGHSIADLLAHFCNDFGHLPAERLRQMAQAHRNWKLWRIRKHQLEQTRQKAKLPALPQTVFSAAPAPEQLDAIVRTARICPQNEVSSVEEWMAILRSGVDLWTRCMAIARKHGQVHCKAKNLHHPDATAYDPYVRCTEKLDEIAPHRWLAMRRGEREGILELAMDLPLDAMQKEVQRFQPQLGPLAPDRSIKSLLQELILDDLSPWLKRNLDIEAQNKAIKAATESLTTFLRTAPVQARQLGAIYLVRPRALVATVVVNREGDPVAHKVQRAEGSWLDKILDFLKEQELQHVILPTSIPAAELLTELNDKLAAAGLQTTKIRTAALAEARLPLTDPPHRLSPSVASAVVLARRALDPLKEWSTVDPVNIGIAEYQNDLDTERLRAALTETVELCRLERRRGKRISMGGSLPKGNTAVARLNPLVKKITDLRPGMSVHGVVTNISHFGAFINIGLPQEALVHISELSDQFVSNPNDVVSIGQQITASVLSVDLSRNRISLSMKTPNRLIMARERTVSLINRVSRPKSSSSSSSSSVAGGGGMHRSAMVSKNLSKAEALANLEKLFKK